MLTRLPDLRRRSATIAIFAAFLMTACSAKEGKLSGPTRVPERVPSAPETRNKEPQPIAREAPGVPPIALRPHEPPPPAPARETRFPVGRTSWEGCFGTITEDENLIVFRDNNVYALDPRTGRTKFLRRMRGSQNPDERGEWGFQKTGDWLIWVESEGDLPGSNWVLRAQNVRTGEEREISRSRHPDDPGPYISSAAGKVAWRQYEPRLGGGEGSTVIWLYDFKDNKKDIIVQEPFRPLHEATPDHPVAGVSNPFFDGEALLWSRTVIYKRRQDERMDVWIKYLDTGEVKQLTKNGHSGIAVRRKPYIAWLYRDPEQDISGEIELYDERTGRIIWRTTKVNVSDERSWPTLGRRFLFWSGEYKEARAYDLEERRLVVFDEAGENQFFGMQRARGDVLAWCMYDTDKKGKVDLRYILTSDVKPVTLEK